MRSVGNLVAAVALGSVLATSVLAQPAYAPARPETLAAVQTFERALAPGIASALDAHGIDASRIQWVRTYAQGGRGPATAYDVALGVAGRSGTVMVLLDLNGRPLQVYGLNPAGTLPR